MKIICTYNPKSDSFIFIKPDTALHNIEIPFFIPEFSQDIRYQLVFVVKISKQGKCIASDFAYKYYEQVTFGVDFWAEDLREKLKAKGGGVDLAHSFDSSAWVGSFFEKNDFFSKTEKEIIFQSQKKILSDDWKTLVEKQISLVSEFFTLKKGDYIFIECPTEPCKAVNADYVRVFFNSDKIISKELK